jgi:hypothetical protein
VFREWVAGSIDAGGDDHTTLSAGPAGGVVIQKGIATDDSIARSDDEAEPISPPSAVESLGGL